MSQPKKKRFQLFNLAKDGKGVKKNERITNFNLGNFFVLFVRRFGTIVSVNLVYVFGNFPILFALLGLSGQRWHQEANVLYPALRAITAGGYTPVTAALSGVIGERSLFEISASPVYTVLFWLTLLLLLTFGPVNTGCAYILRNCVKGDPIFFFQDFFYAIKKNWKQAFLFGAIDLILLALLGYDVVFFYYNSVDFVRSAMFFIALFIAIIYFVMRFYIYTMMVTFDLSIWKLIKNAFIFSTVGFKRNFLACVGMLLVAALTIALILVYLPLGAVLPLVIVFGTCAFMATYAAYPKIKQIMIDPYYRDHPEEAAEEPDVEPVFHDRG